MAIDHSAVNERRVDGPRRAAAATALLTIDLHAYHLMHYNRGLMIATCKQCTADVQVDRLSYKDITTMVYAAVSL